MLPVEQLTPKHVLDLMRKHGPVRLIDLAQSNAANSTRRKKTVKALATLKERGEARMIYLDGVQVYVPTGWRISDEQLQLVIEGRLVARDDCLDWQGPLTRCGAPVQYISPQWGRDDLPMLMHVRRWLWERERGQDVPNSVSLKPTCGSELCVNPAHLKPQHRTAPQKGKRLTVAHRAAIAKAMRQSIGRLTPEQVREIRESNESGPVLAQRYGITAANVNHIKRNYTWRDFDNPFAALAA